MTSRSRLILACGALLAALPLATPAFAQADPVLLAPVLRRRPRQERQTAERFSRRRASVSRRRLTGARTETGSSS